MISSGNSELSNFSMYWCGVINKKYWWTNKCIWYVSISSVNFHGKFPENLKWENFMNHYIHLEPAVKLSVDAILTSVDSLLLRHEASNWYTCMTYGNKLVTYLHWGINKSTFESFSTSVPMPSNISQLYWCLFTISNDKLRFWGTGHTNLLDQHLIHKRMQQLPVECQHKST